MNIAWLNQTKISKADYRKLCAQISRHIVELLKAKEKELAAAKAENGRLVEALKQVFKLTNANGLGGHDCLASSNFICCIASKALSTSNALDYWQGEIRKARDKAKLGIASYLEQFENSVNCDEMAQLIRDDVARQSNPQSKGEKTGG